LKQIEGLPGIGRLDWLAAGESCEGDLDVDELGEEKPSEGAAATVVRRVLRCVVSVEGSGRREATGEACQRKHSPVPKYLGAGCGKSER
jgi:hypothetical protein